MRTLLLIAITSLSLNALASGPRGEVIPLYVYGERAVNTMPQWDDLKDELRGLCDEHGGEIKEESIQVIFERGFFTLVPYALGECRITAELN